MATYGVEYAKSNRAMCKSCGIKIDKDVLRIGTNVPGPGDYMITSWKHLACIRKPAGLHSLEDLAGVSELKASDKQLLGDWMAGNMTAVSASKRKADMASAEAAASTPSTPSKKVKVDAGSSSRSTPVAAACSFSSMSTAAEIEALDAATARFSALSNDALKACLRANDQLLAGTKGDLVERCVDRSVYGNLPRCPHCGIGRLKVAYPRKYGHEGMGTFTCPGGYDDDEYKRCSFRTTSVERPQWIVNEHESAAPKAARKPTGGKSTGGAPSVAATPQKSGGGGDAPAHKAAAEKSAVVTSGLPAARMPGPDE
jgi:hypothetical protein